MPAQEIIPSGIATEATSSALLAAAQAIKAAAEALNGKAQALNTDAVTVVSAPLPAGAATDATLQALQAMQDEIRALSETMLVGLQAILERMPRVTGNDQAAVSIESGSVGIAAGQTLATLTTLTTLSNFINAGGRFVNGDNMNMAGVDYLYNRLEIA